MNRIIQAVLFVALLTCPGVSSAAPVCVPTQVYEAKQLDRYYQNPDRFRYEAPVNVLVTPGERADYVLDVTYALLRRGESCIAQLWLRNPDQYKNPVARIHGFTEVNRKCHARMELQQPKPIDARPRWRTWAVGMDEFPGPLTVSIEVTRQCH